MATLTDSDNKSQVRNIDLFADMIDFYWFIDFGNDQGPGSGGGPKLYDGEVFSFLRQINTSADSSDGNWDIELSFSGEEGLATISVNSGDTTTNDDDRLIRLVSNEGKYSDAKSLPGHMITTNGLANQSGDNLLSAQSMMVEEGGLYLVKIPASSRKSAIDKDVDSGVYVLFFVKTLDEGDQSMEFSYVMRVDPSTEGLNFNNQPENLRDPEYTGHDDSIGGNYGPSAPSRQGYLELNVDDCANLEVDTYDFATREKIQTSQLKVVNKVLGQQISTS